MRVFGATGVITERANEPLLPPTSAMSLVLTSLRVVMTLASAFMPLGKVGVATRLAPADLPTKVSSEQRSATVRNDGVVMDVAPMATEFNASPSTGFTRCA